MRSLLGLCLAVMLLLGALSAPPASAVPGAYRIVMVQADCDPPSKLRGELAALPDVAVVDVFDGCAGTPTAAQLGAYDLVVSMSNANYQDQVAYGNALADFVDGGGVVVQFAYDNWDQSEPDGHNGPTGRFSSGGYEPFLPGDNPNIPVTLGSFDASSPLMQGVSALASVDNTEPELAPEAILVAKWSDDRNLIAYKGRVVSVSAYVGDEEWTGDFARLDDQRAALAWSADAERGKLGSGARHRCQHSRAARLRDRELRLQRSLPAGDVGDGHRDPEQRVRLLRLRRRLHGPRLCADDGFPQGRQRRVRSFCSDRQAPAE